MINYPLIFHHAGVTNIARPGEFMPESWNRKVIELKRRDISYLKFLLEGYDGLVTVTTMDGARGQVSLSFCSSRRPDVENILDALKKEIPLTEMEEHP